MHGGSLALPKSAGEAHRCLAYGAWLGYHREMKIRVHGVTPESSVNGPGKRAVVHLQGCSLGCGGCFNPHTHAVAGGVMWEVSELAERLLESDPDGVTISGGEPLEQLEETAGLVAALRARGAASIAIFSGYAMEEIREMPGGVSLLGAIDLLVAGRYDAQRPSQSPLLSSENQRLHFLSSVHTPAELDWDGGRVEITIRPDGSLHMTGFPDPGLRRAVRGLGESD